MDKDRVILDYIVSTMEMHKANIGVQIRGWQAIEGIAWEGTIFVHFVHC